MGFPFSLEASAASLRVEDAVAVSPESQLQPVSGDQHQRSAVPGVRGELIVPLDVGETQTPGKILPCGGLPVDLEREPASIPPRHGAIGLVFPQPASRLVHVRTRFYSVTYRIMRK
jgi:hypothetical protein